MRIGILDTGIVGQTLSLKLVQLGHAIMPARDPARLDKPKSHDLSVLRMGAEEYMRKRAVWILMVVLAIAMGLQISAETETREVSFLLKEQVEVSSVAVPVSGATVRVFAKSRLLRNTMIEGSVGRLLLPEGYYQVAFWTETCKTFRSVTVADAPVKLEVVCQQQ
jgi:hypothetical protein